MITDACHMPLQQWPFTDLWLLLLKARPKALHHLHTLRNCNNRNSRGSSQEWATLPDGAQKNSLQPPAAAQGHRFIPLSSRRPCHCQMDKLLDCWRCTWLGLHSASLCLCPKRKNKNKPPHTLARACTAVYYQKVFSLLKAITLREGCKHLLYLYYWQIPTKD